MWILSENGFISAVEVTHGDNAGMIVVRARQRDHLEQLSEKMHLSEIAVTPGRDYRYRAWTTRQNFADGLAAVALEIDYPNYKARVDSKGGRLFADVCHRVWSVVEKLQPGGAYGVVARPGYPEIPPSEAG